MAAGRQRGPGRRTGGDTPRSRTAARPHNRARPAASAGVTRRTPNKETRRPERVGSRITGRAVAVIVLVGLLTLSYATSLRVWLDQRQQIAQLNADIRATEERITDLEAELQRWEDPEYVKIQARQRLGWVVPGETGYRVVGPDGKPLGGGAVIDSGEQTEQSSAWYDKVFGSVKTADDPEPAKAQPSGAPRTVGPPPGEETTPSATPTPR